MPQPSFAKGYGASAEVQGCPANEGGPTLFEALHGQGHW
jgi:hypothetical protein